MHLFNRAIRVLLFTNAMILLAGAMLGPIYALFVEEVGGDLLDASVAGGLFALAAGLTTFISGKVSDQIRHSEKIMVFGYAVMGLGFLFYRWTDSVWMLFVIQVLIGFGEAIYSPPFDQIYSKHLARTKAGEQWGAWEAMNYFMAAIGAFLGGLIVHRFGFDVLFVTMAVLCFTSAFYLLFLPTRTLS